MNKPLFAALVALLLAACNGSSDRWVQPFALYQQEPLSEEERVLVVQHVQSVLGYPYTWGGDTLEDGFDCSGLIQWTFREQGVGQFRNGDEVHREITAHDLYHYNVDRIADLSELQRGDFVFFDVNGDGRITHNAVFDRVDGDGDIWVYDAYSVWGVVTHRVVEDFWDKGPLFGRPLKTVPR